MYMFIINGTGKIYVITVKVNGVNFLCTHNASENEQLTQVIPQSGHCLTDVETLTCSSFFLPQDLSTNKNMYNDKKRLLRIELIALYCHIFRYEWMYLIRIRFASKLHVIKFQ